MTSKKQRDRGRILTSDGLSRFQQAIRAWELEHETRCTQERIRELSSAVKEGGLDPGTIRKILKAKEGVDPESIRYLFTTFGLQLDEIDLVSSSRLQTQTDPNFVGREEAIGDLNTLINRGAKVIVIQARGGVGKTTLARKYLQQEFGSYLEFSIAKETKDIASIDSLIEEKLRQLGEEPGREFFVSLDRLKRKLQGERVGILIDNLEPALDSAGKFIELHRRYVELLRVLTDPMVQSVTFITSRERLREASVTLEHYMLRSLDVEAWEQFFQNRNLATDTSAFGALHNAYGGNAKAMDIIRGAILEDYAGDVAAYWQANQHDLFIERDLEDLVNQQFDRLQQIDSDAYNLLCRMGCYRYQDVPTVPIEGLFCLLWDVPENRQRRVVKSLQDRSLVEFRSGEYWLHPIIREEAITQLRGSDYWELAYRKSAKFWAESIEVIGGINDILKLFESCYHYIDIRDFRKAVEVLFNVKYLNSSELKIRFYRIVQRFGLHRQIINAISLIINNIESDFFIAAQYTILGISYRVIGDIHQAIECHHNSLKHIEREIELRLSDETLGSIQALRGYTLVNLGLCKIDLFELENALEFFLEIDQEISEYKFSYSNYTVDVCLAFLYSYFSYQEKTSKFIDEVYEKMKQDTDLGRGYRLTLLGEAYQNIEAFDKAIEIYLEAISHTEKFKHLEYQARAMSLLGEIYSQKRTFETSLKNHFSAIEILRSLGANCNLAEAFYRLGKTYQAMEETQKSKEFFQKAIQLFSEVGAPKQVERVRQAMAKSSIF